MYFVGTYFFIKRENFLFENVFFSTFETWILSILKRKSCFSNQIVQVHAAVAEHRGSRRRFRLLDPHDWRWGGPASLELDRELSGSRFRAETSTDSRRACSQRWFEEIQGARSNSWSTGNYSSLERKSIAVKRIFFLEIKFLKLNFQVAGDWSLYESPEHQELTKIIGPERADRSIPINDLVMIKPK